MCATDIWDAKRYSKYYTQPLYPLFLVSLAGGRYQRFFTNEIGKNKDFLKNKEKADALASLCNKLMEIQKPVLLLAREKLDIDGIPDYGNGGQCNPYGMPKKLRKNSDAKNIYGFFFPSRVVAYRTVYYRAVMNEEAYLSAYSVSYLKYLQNQAELLKDLGFKSTQGENWDQYIEELNKILLGKTESLDDLTSEGKEATQVKTKDSGLDIDDLELPK